MIALLLCTEWGMKNKEKSLVIGLVFDILIALTIANTIGN